MADAARHADRFGVRATLDGVDLAAVDAYAQGVVQRLYRGLTGLVRSHGITVVEGAGRLVPGDGVTGDPEVGRAADRAPLVLATGSAPKTLPGLEIDGGGC